MLVLSCLVAGCGYKTNPRPATAAIPGEVGLVHAQAYPDRIILKWDVPVHNTDGSPLKDISGFKVYRIVERIGEECEDCEAQKGTPTNIDFQNPANAVIKDGEVVFTDKNVDLGHTYSYAVTAYNLKGREGRASQDVAVVFDSPPPVPANLRADVEANGVRLEWDAPGRLAGLQGYSVYRGTTDAPDKMKPVGRTKWAETYWVDEGVEKNQTYYYVVRSIKMNRGVPLESDPSSPVQVAIPPPRMVAPENVGVEARPDGVRVHWDPVKGRGMEIQYDVYRSESGRMFAKRNTEPIDRPWFLDTGVKKGRTYRYGVTAFPKGRPEEQSSRSGSQALRYNP